MNEYYLIVCICGQRKGQPPTGYLPTNKKSNKNASLNKKANSDSSLLWICPECLSKNSASSCNCGFQANESELKTYSVDQTASNLHSDIIFNRKMGNKQRADFLLGYFLKRFPDSKEACQEKGNTHIEDNPNKILCPHCDEMIPKLSTKCPICAEVIDHQLGTHAALSKTKERPFVASRWSKQPAAQSIPKVAKSSDSITEVEVKMTKLKQLLDRGLITQNEYDQRRKELIDKYMA